MAKNKKQDKEIKTKHFSVAISGAAEDDFANQYLQIPGPQMLKKYRGRGVAARLDNSAVWYARRGFDSQQLFILLDFEAYIDLEEYLKDKGYALIPIDGRRHFRFCGIEGFVLGTPYPMVLAKEEPCAAEIYKELKREF